MAILVALAIVAVTLNTGLRILREYERAVVRAAQSLSGTRNHLHVPQSSSG
jgi:hypothetical protein